MSGRLENRLPLHEHLGTFIDVDNGPFDKSNLSAVLNGFRINDDESMFLEAVLDDLCKHVIFL